MAKKVQRGWFTEIKGGDTILCIVEKTSRTVDGITDEWQAVTETGLFLNIEFIGTDADLTSTSSTWNDINDRYHRSIVNKVISRGYTDPRNMDINTAQYFDAEYEKGVRKAKKMARSHYYQGSGRIIPQDF